MECSVVVADGREWRCLSHESGRKATYGELATDASAIAVPADSETERQKGFQVDRHGRAQCRQQADDHGQAVVWPGFYREGMLFAMLAAPARIWHKIKSVDAAAAKAMPGIVDVVTFKNNVAVVGKSTWQVNKARKALKIEYEPDGAAALESTADHDQIFKELVDSSDPNVVSVKRKDGDVDAAFKTAAKVITQGISMSLPVAQSAGADELLCARASRWRRTGGAVANTRHGAQRDRQIA